MPTKKSTCPKCSGSKAFTTVNGVAEMLQCSARTVYKMINNADLMAYTLSDKPGSAIRIRVSDVEALLKPVIPPKVYADMRSRQPSPLHRPIPLD